MLRKFGDLLLDRLVFSEPLFQKAQGNPRSFFNAPRRQDVYVGALITAIAEGVGFYDAFLDQRPQAKIGLPEADTQFAGNLALADSGVFLDQAENAVARFVGESEGHGGIRSLGERMMPQGSGVIKSLVGSTGAVGNAHPSQIHDVPILVGSTLRHLPLTAHCKGK